MSLIAALQFASAYDPPEVTVPELAVHFDVSQSTTDNWVRRGVDLGLLDKYRPQPGEWEDSKGSVGRPPCVYTLTAKGKAAAEAGELPARKNGKRPAKAAKAKGKAKAPKRQRPAKAPKEAKPTPPPAPAKDASPAALLARVEAGESQTALAAEFGLSRHQVARKVKAARKARG